VLPVAAAVAIVLGLVAVLLRRQNDRRATTAQVAQLADLERAARIVGTATLCNSVQSAVKNIPV